MTHYKPWKAPITACGQDSLEANTTRDLALVVCTDCLTSTHADRGRRVAEAETFYNVELGFWRTGRPEPVLMATDTITDQHLGKILTHLQDHLEFYALEGLPRPLPHMSDNSRDSYGDMLGEWQLGNSTWQAMYTPRFASIIREALKRGWPVANLEEPDNGYTDFLQVRGWKDTLEHLHEIE